MAYGVLYEFHRTSTNGADMLITISQKGYNGAVKKRALGRAPVIKRDNNGHIYGTSCELYAECLVDGEFSHLYTSDAYEYKVEVYKNNTLLWAGFVSPELYSEPDIAPPYDVQIIATDGLGELKNYNFNKRGAASILDHINALMANTGIEMGFNVVSGLRYIDENGAASADKDILSVKLDLDHEEGNSCYDVLQGILSSLNANITQHNGSYLIFRETDFITKAGAQGVEAFNVSGNKINLGVASFGTMKENQWWPVGQLSTVIEPAKNQIVLTSPNHYKGNVLRFDNWTTSEMASFSEAENAYVLLGADSYITQTIDFGGHQVGYRLGLRVRARNVGTATEEEQNIGLKVEMEGQTSAVGPNYWLVKPATGGRRPASGYMWRNTEVNFEEDLSTPSEAEDASDAQDIDIVLPLYREGPRAFAYAKRIKLTIFNPKGLYNIYVYDVSLVKYEQIKGYEANVTIDNVAREAESDVNLTITAGDLAPAAGNVFMTGLPLRPTDSEVITKWQIGDNASQDYLAAMAFDYSRGISLPRMKYSGILNVPGSSTVLPTLFLRDGTYYFPHTYSYDLYSDEITVELISISAADISLSSVAISQTTEAAGTMGATTGGTSGGGGAVSIPRDKQMSDTSDNAVENKVIKAYVDSAVTDIEKELDILNEWKSLKESVLAKFTLDSDGNVFLDGNLVVKGNLIVEGDTASGGTGENTPSSGGIDLEALQEYLDDNQYINQSNLTTQLNSLSSTFNSSLDGKLSTSGGYMYGTLTVANGNNLTMKAASGSNDTGDIIFRNGDDAEIGRIWLDHTTSTFMLRYSDMVSRTIYHSGNLTASTLGALTSHQTIYSLVIQNSVGNTQLTYTPNSTAARLVLTKAMVGLGNVENTALSTWAGTSNITTLGTITSGTWNGSKIANAYLANNAITIAGTSVSLGGSIAASTITAAQIGSGNSFYHSGNVNKTSVAWNCSSLTMGGALSGVTTGSFSSTLTTKTLVISSNASEEQLKFSRGGGNSILTPTNGYFRFFSNGKNFSNGDTDADLIIKNSLVRVNGNAEIKNGLSIYGGTNTEYSEGIRLHTANDGWIALMFCGADNTGGTGTSANSWGIFTDPNSNFVINRAASTNLSTNALCNVGGNWGIGTLAPAYKLDVNGSLHASTATIDSGITTTTITCNYIYKSDEFYIGSAALGVNTSGALIYTYNSTPIYFYTGGAARMSIDGNGLVGIANNLAVLGSIGIGGIINPQYTLDVSGSACAKIYYGGATSGTGSNSSGMFRWGTFDESKGGLKLQFGSESGAKFEILNSAWNKALFSVNTEADCTIGRNLIVTGDASSGSDMRFKNIIEHKVLKIEDIANAPCFSFKWNNRENDYLHLGTSAQYWEERVPELVSGNDFKTLNYASLGVAMGISLAKKAQSHEDRIKMLEDEVKVLNQEINRLRNGVRLNQQDFHNGG